MVNKSSSFAALHPSVKNAGISFLRHQSEKHCIIVERQAFQICYECQELLKDEHPFVEALFASFVFSIAKCRRRDYPQTEGVQRGNKHVFIVYLR